MPTIPIQGGVPLACPRDGGALRPFTVADITVDTCAQCAGTWFDHGELARVTHDDELARLAADVQRAASESGFLCLRCRGPCARVAVVDVEVDACAACGGIWMDGGELTDARVAVATRRWEGSRLARLLGGVREAQAAAARPTRSG